MLQQKDYSEITIVLERLYVKSYFILKYLTSYWLKDIMDTLFFILHTSVHQWDDVHILTALQTSKSV